MNVRDFKWMWEICCTVSDTTFIWHHIRDHIHLRSYSFYATLKWSCFDLLWITFLWSTFHFFAGGLKFCKVTLHLKFAKITPFRVQGDSRWVVNALALQNTAEARKLHISGLEGSVAHLKFHLVRPSQIIMCFCVPARFLYRDAAIFSVFHWEMKDKKRKKGLFALVETITGENVSHTNVVSN